MVLFSCLCCAVLINFKDIISLCNGFFLFFPQKKKKKQIFYLFAIDFSIFFPKKKNKIFYLFAIDFSIFFLKEKGKKKKKKDILSLVCWRVGVCMRVSNHLQDIIFI
jgi:hypothetical protein